MKETRFYQKALNLSLLDGKKMKAAMAGRIAAIPAVTREKRSFSYRKFGLVAVDDREDHPRLAGVLALADHDGFDVDLVTGELAHYPLHNAELVLDDQ